MSNRGLLTVVLLGLLTFALVPGAAMAAGQGQDLTEMLATSAAAHATAASGPIITVSPLSFNFGVVDKNTTTVQNIQICNTGDAFLNVMNVAFSDPAYSLTVAAGGLSPGVCTFPGNIQVAFHPLDGLAHPATMTITSDASNGTQIIPLSGQGNSAPVLSPIGNKTVSSFSTLAFTCTANDLDDTVDDVLTFSMSAGLPPSATFDTGTGAFSWTPSDAEVGNFTVTFGVSDGRLSDTETISIAVSLTNRPPVANAGGSYNGATGRPLQFNGAGSSDPDVGQMLAYAWAFGDGSTGTGQNPVHTYQIPGSFLASLTVCDNGTPQLCASDVAAVTIQSEIGAQIILPQNGTILNAKKDNEKNKKFGIEEVILPYTDLDQASLRLSTTYPNAGSVSECAPYSGTKFKYGDMDIDGVTDLDFRFPQACIHDLFDQTPNGQSVDIVISGTFHSGSGTTPLRAIRTITIKTANTGAPVASFASPNPFNPETSISYSVKGNGPVTIRIFGINGRLVRSLKVGEATRPGSYEVRWNGTNEQGRPMPSGIYFVKTTQAVAGGEQTSVLKVALAK